MEALEGVGGDLSRSPRAPEALSRDQSQPKERSGCSKNRLWTILRRFLSDSKASEVLRASAGPSRGALLPKSTFFASVPHFCSILPFPRPLRLALGLPLGTLWGPLAALGVPLGLPNGALGPSWGPFWRCFGGLLGDLRTPEGPQDAPGTELKGFLARSGINFHDCSSHFCE